MDVGAALRFICAELCVPRFRHCPKLPTPELHPASEELKNRQNVRSLAEDVRCLPHVEIAPFLVRVRECIVEDALEFIEATRTDERQEDHAHTRHS